jgi:hypothetical protein
MRVVRFQEGEKQIHKLHKYHNVISCKRQFYTQLGETVVSELHQNNNNKVKSKAYIFILH